MKLYILIEDHYGEVNIIKVYSDYTKALEELNKIPKVRRKLYEIKVQ